MSRARAAFDVRTVDDLRVEDEDSLRHVALYAELKEVLRRSKYPFRVLPAPSSGRVDRAIFLNLTFWTANEGGDFLARRRVDADVIAHAAWHHVAARALATNPREKPSVAAMFLGEAIASAFDVYLVGRLLGHAPRSTFLETQVPAMAESAYAAGLSKRQFERLLAEIARDPDRAFAALRELLTDGTRALFRCRDGGEGLEILASFDANPFASLLHRYELSNWILHARAYGARREDARVRGVDRALRNARAPLDWLAERWISPLLSGPTARDSRRGAKAPRAACDT